jgi:hypothetical protein
MGAFETFSRITPFLWFNNKKMTKPDIAELERAAES